MRLFPPALEIGDTEGFTAKNDIFGRKKLADGLSNLLRSVADPMVLAVDGQWGSGKTAFLKMWAGSLRNEGFPVVYFDAFENDFADDAFTALASQIIMLLAEHKKLKTKKAEVFLKHAKSAGKILLRSGVRLGVKVVTLNVLDTKELEDSAAAVADELSDLADKQIGERLTRHREHIATFDAFRGALAELPEVLCGVEKSLPLILIVDELDRCKPAYALELLERIKHFFAVNDVHFVLGVHLTQLENSVSAAYGSGIDAKMYLQKFVHLVAPLVDEAEHVNDTLARKYIIHLRTTLEFKPEDAETVRAVSDALVRISNARGLSLRSIERAMGYVALALAFTGPNTLRPPSIIAGLAVIKATNPTLYRKAKSGTLTYDEVEGALSLPARKSDDTQNEMDVNWWRFCVDKTISPEFRDKMMQGMARYSFWDENINLSQMFANEVMDRLHKS